MEERQSPTATHSSSDSTSRGWRSDLSCLLALILLAIGLRTWQIRHTEVTSRDSIGFIEVAWRLEHGNWLDVIPNVRYHPAYPISVLAMSLPVRRLTPGDLATTMQLSAQLASSLAGVLLVVPMFYLGREMFDRRVGFWAAALFQCLPTSGRLLGDGLSESLFLLFVATGLLFAARGLRTGRPWCFAVVGLAGALAYLTRPEGLVVVAATGIVLLLMQVRASSRQSRAAFLQCGASLSAMTLVVAIPFMYLIHGLTVKPSGNLFMKPGQKEERMPWLKSAQSPALDHGVATRPPLAMWYDRADVGATARRGWGLKALLTVLGKSFFIGLWLPALLALWWFRDLFRRVPGAWVMLLTCLLMTAALYRIAVLMGYLSDRHTVLILLCGTYSIVVGIGLIASWLAALLRYLRPLSSRWVNAETCSVVLLVAATTAPLARTLQPLHADRAGFRAAGSWLAREALPGDRVIDPYCWASYYAGRLFLQSSDALPAHHPGQWYIVLERSSNAHAHLVQVQQAEMVARLGKVIQRWEVPRGKRKAEVQVILVPLPPGY